jgi:hypothetical protein
MAEDIPRRTKKMLLFASPENGFWPRVLRKPSPSQNEISDYMGISLATIPGWKNNGAVSENAVTRMFDDTREQIEGRAERKHKHSKDKRNFPLLAAEERDAALQTLEQFRKDYYDDQVSIYLTAEHLGMTTQDSQMIIDRVIYKRGPVFPRMYSESPAPAAAVWHTYQGVYHLWARRQLDSEHSGIAWLQAPLRVRYVLNGAGGYLVRCKLNAPMIVREPRKFYWEYDGFLVKKHNRIFWLFEKRERDRNDHFYFITDTGRPCAAALKPDDDMKYRTMFGRYLSTEQDDLQSIASDQLILQRLTEPRQEERAVSAAEVKSHIREEEKKMTELMHTSAAVIRDEQSCAKLVDLWTKFGQRRQAS